MSATNPELFDLVEGIAEGKYTKKQVNQKIDQIEKKYSPGVFVWYPPERKEKPWDVPYLKKLEDLFYCGATSKEFILYMAEVSNEIYRAKRIRRAVLVSVFTVAALAVIGMIIKTLLGD